MSTPCKLTEIFEHQEGLHEKFRPIEIKNGVGAAIIEGHPLDYDCYRWQSYFKDMSHRVIEELTESRVSYSLHSDAANKEDADHHYADTIEELIDALHFLTEYCIVVGIRPLDLLTELTLETYRSTFDEADLLDELVDQVTGPTHPSIDIYYMNMIVHLGQATNYLRNRPWKSSKRATDVPMFELHIILAYGGLVQTLTALGLDAQDIHSAYLKKNKTNQDRIRSGQ